MQNFEFICLRCQVVRKRGVAWGCPTEGVFTFNVDDSMKGASGKSGIGGVLRDHCGEIKGFLSKSMGH